MGGGLRPDIHDVIADPRLRYEHVGMPLSMTENWHRGMARCRGQYVSVIGDDDAIHPEIGRIARWAQIQGVEALRWNAPADCRYYWPNYPGPQAGTYRMYPHTGVVRRFLRGDSVFGGARRERWLPEKALAMPSVYHGMVRSDFLEQVRSRSGGMYFLTAAPDTYMDFFLSTIVRETWWVDFPVSTIGASAKSNTAIAAKIAALAPSKRRHTHLNTHLSEYATNDLSPFAPRCEHIAIGDIVDGIARALSNAEQPALIESLDLADCFALALYHEPQTRLENVRRYLQASALLRKDKLRSGSELMWAFLRRARGRMLTHRHPGEVGSLDSSFSPTTFHGLKDVHELLRVQQTALTSLRLRSPWDA